MGLITGVGLAAKGHEVTCFDNQHRIVEGLNRNNPHIYEKGLKEMLNLIIDDGLFTAQLISERHLINHEMIIVAVGTPSVKDAIDLKYIKSAAAMIGCALRSTDNFISVIIKSTVVPGTTDTLVRHIIEENSGKKLGQFGLGMNPEFLREGNAIDDFTHPDRIVLGYEDPKALEMLHELYNPWDCEKIAVNTRTAEMIKYANNCLLATQISAVNELANIAAAVGGIDILDVMKGVHLDKRWNPILPDGKRANPDILSYLVPGCGFGGSCFPKDLKGLKSFANELGLETYLFDSVLKTNDNQPYEVIKLLKATLGNLKNKKILILGLAFKPDTDDIRESVSLIIINDLFRLKADIIAHDPIGIPNARKVLNTIHGMKFTEEWKECLSFVDAVVVLTKWEEYKQLADKINCERIKGKVLIDPRRLFKPEAFQETTYLSMGWNKGNNI